MVGTLEPIANKHQENNLGGVRAELVEFSATIPANSTTFMQQRQQPGRFMSATHGYKVFKRKTSQHLPSSIPH
jgi:hypothetical protein